MALGGSVALAGTVNVGYVSWDVTFPGNSGSFDITNLSGANVLPPDFLSTTPVTLSDLSLTVEFVGGGSTVFGPSYFTLAGDGLSFNGDPIAIGGTNPLPTKATLTGTFSPLTLSLDGGGTLTINPSFTALIIPATGGTLADGDLAVIVATEFHSGVPEPGSALMVASGVFLVAVSQRRKLASILARMGAGRLAQGAALALMAAVFSAPAYGAVNLAGLTTPSTGTAGVNTVNITGSSFPAGTITPANVSVTFALSCGGATVATAPGSSVVTVIGSTKRIGVLIPGTLLAATYFVAISDSAAGDANFTSSNCSRVTVTRTNPTLSACIPTSSLGVLVPSSPGDVVAYVPKGYWSGGATGVHVKKIEGTPALGTSIPTAAIVNSCSSNPATGQTVCVGNNRDVYLITGSTLNTTLTSAATGFANFSGGSCQNCGVAINALTNKAVIAGGFPGGASGQGVQLLDLNTNTFGAPFGMNKQVSENISVDPTRNLILTPGEDAGYTILQIQPDGVTLKELAGPFTGLTNDSAGEDCSTGIAMTPGEFSNTLFMQDLTQATFGATSYTAPSSSTNLVTAYGFSAGLSGLTVAPGSNHLGVATGEFGGQSFAVLQLPATSGTGTPTLVDYATALIPPSAACGSFSAGFDPHTITAYTSPNDGKSYAVFVGYSGSSPVCLAKVDLAAVLAAPRGGPGLQPNDVSGANFPAAAVQFFTLP